MLKTSMKKQLTDISRKMDRRESTTSESSVEPMDLGRTPMKMSTDIKKESSSTTATLQLSTPTHKDAILSDANTKLPIRHESDADESDERDRDHQRRSHSQHHYHHRRRGNSGRDKRTVHLECTDSPHSLRKRFRISSNQNAPEPVSNLKQKISNNDSTTSAKSMSTNITATTNNNESGFVDASSSHVLNTSGSSATSSASSSSSPTSSSSASPSASNIASVVSSPESGMGERDDMKYLCPICEVVSATPHEFTNHIRCHNYSSGDTENFTCRICSKVLSSASSLDRHVLVHTGERPFNCKYCQLTFTTNGNMHRHMRTHKQHQQHYHRNSNGTKTSSGGGGSGSSGGGSGAGAGNSGASSLIPSIPSADQSASATATANTIPSKIANATNGVINSNGDTIASGGGGESYESDGGCSTDSSSGISQSSNNNNNSNTNNKNISNFKRKSTDSLDDMALMKRRVKTTINNNNIIDNVHNEKSTIEEADIIDALRHQQQQKLFCPVCNRNDFMGMLALATHMDCDHSDIPAKCRHCDVVFKTHKQLNVHPCTSKHKITGFKDLTFVDFSSEKFPVIAKSLCEQSLRTPISSQRFECTKCYRAFPCASAVEIHEKDCLGSGMNLFVDTPDFSSSRKQRAYSESSGGADDDDNRRDEFFARLYLKNKSTAQSMTSLSASSPSLSDVKSSELDKTPVKMSHLEQFQDSKELADIQSILNITSSSSNFLRNFENSVNAPISNYGAENGEEEAQDAFTSEFRKMKLRGEFPCKLCTAVFPNLRALKGHNRIHLSAAGPGPYRCNMCTYSIHDKAALVRHMRTHNGDRPYECAICNYAFTTKANCERHLRNRHSKTTRDDVKRAIIYHPSEDSNCDDAMKKLHMFSSPEFDQDDLEQHHPPKDRSTPVSHLKEMLQAESKPLKIQVKSLEKLIDKPSLSFSHSDDVEKEPESADSQQDKGIRPMDLSMDALDLSKKSVKSTKNEEKPPQSPTPSQPATGRVSAEEQNIDIRLLEKNQELLLTQQRLLHEAMPKMDPAHYMRLSQLYQNLVFPLHPILLQNAFFPNTDLNKFPSLVRPLFEHAANLDAAPSLALNNLNQSMQPKSASEETNLLMKQSSSRSHSPNPAKSQLLPRNSPHPSASQMPPMARNHPHMVPGSHSSGMLPSSVPNSGPVKMVIKNGVLMPKQKQRRYRTERPFACEHCSARFTLRSNMERHIKQQHPQYWAQRQRSGHHIMRGRGNTSVLSHMQTPHSPLEVNHPISNSGIMTSHLSAISDQVKYAILAQQLKARKDTDILQQALSQGSSSVLAQNPTTTAISSLRKSLSSSSNTNNGSIEDDDPKLVIDEDEEKDEDEDEDEEDRKPENLTKIQDLQAQTSNEAAKKMAESILEQAMKASSTKNSYTANSTEDDRALGKDFGLKLSKNMIAQAEFVGKSLKEVASSPFKDESNDLVSVSRLVDNATNSMSFNNYFRPSDVVNQLEQSDEEGLVASGSASESNNSGPEDMAGSQEPKKKSAYSSAPNRVSCPYCQRMFPWSSSLRRHILTHTGQKPFKCSHCPLLFTTKSNCDRHLLRKHGNVESAVSLYVPIEDVNEPLPVPKSVEEIELQQQQQMLQQQQQKKMKEQRELEKIQPPQPQKQPSPETQEPVINRSSTPPTLNSVCKVEPVPQIVSSSELPFKCHLCDNSFAERFQCLDHIKIHHAQEFALLLSKGAIDNEADANSQVQSTEDDEKRDESRGKYPDYTNRKVICAFCVRRFWSTEDLRRHMRTHSGERPFQCDICLRKFTLKHSMLRHMKKHSGGGHSSNGAANAGNSGSDISDDEQPPSSVTLATSLRSHKIQELFSKATSEWRNNRLSGEHKENIEEHNNQSDLIGNLLGISDQGILNKLLSSADEAAKFLGVEK